MTTQSYSLPPTAHIGHVHLRVADLDRSIAFYRDALGFTLRVDGRTIGIPVAFLAAGDYHHHIALNTFESAGGTTPASTHTGIYHLAIVYPDRASLIRAVEQVLACGGTIDGGRDHGATVSVYLRDPDRTGIELYYDRPLSAWVDANGTFIVKNDPFDVAALLSERNDAAAA
jgi:catechol 2,3-dioxygenase